MRGDNDCGSQVRDAAGHLHACSLRAHADGVHDDGAGYTWAILRATT